MNILLLETAPEIKIEYLDYLKIDHNIFTIEDNFNDDEIEIIMVRTFLKVDKKVLDRYKKLKVVAKL
jgi:hypothetical protein